MKTNGTYYTVIAIQQNKPNYGFSDQSIEPTITCCFKKIASRIKHNQSACN